MGIINTHHKPQATVFAESGGKLRDAAAGLWRYGLAPLRAKRLAAKAVDRFLAVRESKGGGE